VLLLIALCLSFKLHIEQSAARQEEQMVLQG
jgi:hypothetical protein